ncbi:hypothetical protein [Moorena sp. SIO4G3]|nr:hypothetical protein [Moorena sp. SIO4G3]NEO80950.1 hypothetical protein [Moorena sp. SIO4G3]
MGETPTGRHCLPCSLAASLATVTRIPLVVFGAIADEFAIAILFTGHQCC